MGSQPAKYMALMAVVQSRTSEESRLERERQAAADKDRGKESLTEQYLDHVSNKDNDPIFGKSMADPTATDTTPQIGRLRNPEIKGRSPDGFAAVPGLLRPRPKLGRK